MAFNLKLFSRQIQYRPAYNLVPDTRDLGNIHGHDFGKQPAPIVSLAVGSTGIQRTALWYNKMRALGCADRIQSLMVYDCNATNIREWNAAAEAAGISSISITPEYLPFPEGFLRQPNFFKPHYAAISRDVEIMVEKMERIANETGVRPQVIIEWIGFGGHAQLSYLIHEHVARRFPNTTFLPIYCIPSDRVLEANIRDYGLWDQAQQAIGDHPAVITDNLAGGTVQTLDERVAITIAAIEAAYRFRPEVGTLAELVSSFRIGRSRWLGIDTIELPYQITKARQRQHSRAQREQRMVRSAVAQGIKEAIWRIARPTNQENHTAFFNPPQHNAEQRIYCLLPFHYEVVDLIKEDIEDQLMREMFHMPFSGTKICFAPGNAMWRSNDSFAYAHICRIIGAPATPLPVSVTRVLDATEGLQMTSRSVLTPGEELMAEIRAQHASANGSNPEHDPDRSSNVPIRTPDFGNDPGPLWHEEELHDVGRR